MQLRNHPLMAFEGKPNWPPIWRARDNSWEALTGEIGVLTFAIRDTTSDSRCFLMIEHRGKGYLGTLSFDQPFFCSCVCELLNDHIGRSIQHIADFDIA